ncbi:MAG: cyclase family protein [Halobacteriaceae archaeon]
MTLVDCSHPIETGMPTYPGDPDVALSSHATHESDGYSVTGVQMGSHTGTHVDAPRHTEPDGKTLDAFSVADFRFDARIVDLPNLDDRDAIPPTVVPNTDADMLVFRTGWDAYWDTPRYAEHPYLAPATAERCAEAGYHVGLDTLSPDPTPTESATAAEPSGVPAHHALLGADCLVVENLTGLGGLPRSVTLHAYPLALGVDGAPVRAVAEPNRAHR